MRGSRGFTLIELTIALAIAALATATAVASVNAITDASLHSSAVTLTGAIKMCYDRAIMLRRTQRIAMDMEKGTWWVEFTEEPYALSRERLRGNKGEDEGGESAEEQNLEAARSMFSKDKDEFSLEAGRAARFAVDSELDAGKPTPLPDNVRFERIWTGHQEEPFTGGVAHLHFFPGGFSEPAIIQLEDEDGDIVSLKVSPLTGRVRSYDKALDTPKVKDDDGRDEGDE